MVANCRCASRVGNACAILGDRDEAVGAVLALDHSHARVGQVESDQLGAISGEPIKQLATRRRRLIRDVVGSRLPFGMLERNQRVSDDVAADDQPVAAGEL